MAIQPTQHALHGHTHTVRGWRHRASPSSSRSGGWNSALIGRCSTRAVSDSRATATRAPPASSSIDLGRVTWHRVAYDIGRVQSAMRSVRLPERLVARLSFGCDRPDAAGRRVIGAARRCRPQAGRSTRSGSSGPRPVLPIHRRGPTTAKGRQRPDDPGGRLIAKVRAIVLGPPLHHQDEELGERLSKTKALAIFSSDAISPRPTRPRRSSSRSSWAAPRSPLQYSLPVSMAIAGLSPSSPSAIARCASRTRRGRLVLGVEGELRSHAPRSSRHPRCSSTTT